jgi:hypothetical protein
VVVGGSVAVGSNASLHHLRGLGALRYIGDELRIIGNRTLPTCEVEELIEKIGDENIGAGVIIADTDHGAVCD